MTGADDQAAGDLGERIIDAWHHPKYAFLLGLVAGSVIVGSLMLSSPAALQGADITDIGEQVVDHYQRKAPTGLSYELNHIEPYSSTLYAATIQVERGGATSEETVYITTDGKWVFTEKPEHVNPSLDR